MTLEPTNHNPSDAAAPGPKLAGTLAEFRDPRALVAAAAAIRDAGYRRWDCYSPFPVHGIDAAMGVGRTGLPWLVLAAGTVGGGAALLMQWWMNAVDYKFLISGKPAFSLPSDVPVMFELIVLAAAIAAFVGTLALCRLPEWAHPLLGNRRFRRATTDGLFLAIESADPAFDAAATPELLGRLGAVAVEPYYVSEGGRRFPAALAWTGAVLAAIAIVPPLWIARVRSLPSETPRIEVISDMDFQPKYKSLAPSRLFADGNAARPPVPHTIARGEREEDDAFYRGKEGTAWVARFPVRVTEAAMRRGQEQFGVYCAACHGLAGKGDGVISQRAFRRQDSSWVRPSDLLDEPIRRQPVGQLFDTISHGVRKMPAYGAQIPSEDRWAIVLYLRALQRSQNATIDDVPKEMRDRLK